jgi:vacuolar-type H+-ATPase subunit I/STV1
MYVGKTIGLKLNDKEERIVSQLTREGITHSELLRDALWHYFTSPDKPVNQIKQDEVNIGLENVNPIVRDYINHLKEEINQLRQENARLQEQIESEMSRLHGHIYKISTNSEMFRNSMLQRETRSLSDIHSDIDNFLKKEKKI